MTSKFYCDKCGEEFFSEEECEEHERLCGINVSELRFTTYNDNGKKICSNDLEEEERIDYAYIYIEDADTFDTLNEIWRENGYITIPNDIFEENSIYAYDDDDYDGWVNYTKKMREGARLVRKMMAEK